MKSIQSRLTTLFVFALVIIVALTGFIMFQYERLIIDNSALTEKIHFIQTISLKAEVSFKTQVQEWKNILLRGYDDKLYEKYLKSFRVYEAETQRKVEDLVSKTIEFPEINKDAKQFLAAHKKLGIRYREALPVYKLAISHPHITTDKYVRGIDRAPIKLLSGIVDKTEVLYNATLLKRNKKFTELKFYIAYIFSFTIVVLILIFWLATKKGISQPLNNMSILLKDIAEGDKDLTLRLDTHNLSELKLTANWFNVFINNIQTLMVQINEAGDNLSDASYESAKANERTNQAIANQQTAMTQVSISMQQITENIKTVADNAQLTTESTKLALNTTSVGYDMVVEAVSRINNLSKQINNSTKIVRQLADETSKVGVILNAITAIAEQTDLLALNAAIEAARAGEHGRGFAVVADEVRNLSQKTRQATVQIHDLVNNMQASSKDAVGTMEASHEQVVQTADLANTAGSSLEKINSTLAEIDTMNKNIAESSVSQSEATIEINSTIININKSIANTISDAKQNTSNSSDLAQLATLLHMLINEFKVGNKKNEKRATKYNVNDEVELF